MILDLEPVHDGENEKHQRAERDSSLGGMMIAILVVVLLIACGTSFGIGYAVGHYFTPAFADKPAQTASATPNATAALPMVAAGATAGSLGLIDSSDKDMSGVSKPPTPATAAQGKPAAAPQTAAAQAKPAAPQAAPQAKPAQAAPATAQTKPAAAMAGQSKPATVQSAKAKPAPSASKHSPSHNTQVAYHSSPTRGPDPFKHLISDPNYGAESSSSRQPMVQVAVLTRDEDASILIDALSRHGYSAAANRESDHRIHIRLGPFSSRTDASAMRDKLLGDGYNAVVQ